jgi:hypothetical protein
MVGLSIPSRLDPVAKRLAAAPDERAADVLDWLERQQRRDSMRRRAFWCTVGGWLLMTTAAAIGSLVTIMVSGTAREILGSGDIPEWIVDQPLLPATVSAVPALLVLVTLFLAIGGIVGWLNERIPIFSKTASAIDWSAASDAVTRLLSVGCTYPEAFRTAAQITRSSPSRRWLTAAALRVELGGAVVVTSPYSRGDAAVLELMIDAAEGEPQRQWRVASDHYLELAHRRLVLLLQSTPMIATIISGLLIWISISSTLGWLWGAVAQMCRGLS